MSFQLLPVTSDSPNYKFEIDLDKISYFFSFQWNDRFGRWMMSIFNASQKPLIEGVPIVLNSPLYRQYSIPGLPPGDLFAYDPAGDDTEPGRNDLGNRVRLCYVEVGTA